MGFFFGQALHEFYRIALYLLSSNDRENIGKGIAMRIIGLGSEIVECVRIGRMIERHGELFLARTCTPREIHICRGKKHVTEHFAERWAAKRAILKCLGMAGRLNLSDIEVREGGAGEGRAGDGRIGEGRAGEPKVYMCGWAAERTAALRISDIQLTMAHCRAYATAVALALGAVEA